MEHIKSILANQEIWKNQEKRDRNIERISISSEDEDMDTPEPANKHLVDNTNPGENSDTDDDECIITKLKVIHSVIGNYINTMKTTAWRFEKAC